MRVSLLPPLTQQQIEALKEQFRSSTPEPYQDQDNILRLVSEHAVHCGASGKVVAAFSLRHDLELFLAMRRAIPQLVTEIENRREEAAQLCQCRNIIQVASTKEFPFCSKCGRKRFA